MGYLCHVGDWVSVAKTWIPTIVAIRKPFFVRLTSKHRNQNLRKSLNLAVIYVIFIQNSIVN